MSDDEIPHLRPVTDIGKPISTVVRELATARTVLKIACMRGSVPTTLSRRRRSSSADFSAWFSFCSAVFSSARSTATSTWSGANGLPRSKFRSPLSSLTEREVPPLVMPMRFMEFIGSSVDLGVF